MTTKKITLSQLVSDVDIKMFMEDYHKPLGQNDMHLHRYSSFDYCYNYFQSFYQGRNIKAIASTENIERSVLQLAFYLASWGMYRGSSALLEHSSRILIPVVNFISHTNDEDWEIDVCNFSERSAELMNLYVRISDEITFPFGNVEKKQKPTSTLITKIMLGVFGNTPAFDTNFMKGIGRSSSYNITQPVMQEIWSEIQCFYNEKKHLLDEYRTSTLSFNKNSSKFTYPYAKIIDVIFFKKGEQIINDDKKTT